MSWKRVGALVLIAAAFQSAPVEGGVFGCFKREKCEPWRSCETECAKPKHSCCLCPEDVPRGDIAFSIPGVTRAGQAVPISNPAVRRALSEGVAREARQNSRALGEETLEDRLGKLEEKVGRIMTLVEKHDEKLNK